VVPSGSGGAHSPVRIGFTTVPDAAAVFAAVGGKTANVDQAALLRNAIARVNKNGGLNGHPIQAFIEAVSATSQESYDQQYQNLCQKYTRDDKVVAAGMVGIGANTNMDACMNKAKTLFLTGSNTLHDAVDYARTPYVVSPMEVSSSVLAKTLAQLIVSRGFEKSGGKVGILTYDIPEYDRAVDQQLKPILAAAGIGLIRYTIPPPASTAAIGDSVSVVQSAELKMASQGVKTVTFLCAGCAAFFIQSANSQNYYPRYVLSSMDSPGAADGSTYEKALRSSVSVGWEPNADYGSTTPPAPVPHSSTYDECLKIQKPVITSSADIPIAMITCDEVLDFYYAARANPVEPITSVSLRDGMLKLGTSHPSALSFATDLTPQKHAGARQYRLMTWNDRCACPAYSGPALEFPAV
jgi:ABC-type branched-subunit amino acid transport system substrate-binding protein